MQDAERGSRTVKLVRDRIPQIVRESGAEPVVYVAEPGEYRQRLREKIAEEHQEVLEADAERVPEEVADLVEAALT